MDFQNLINHWPEILAAGKSVGVAFFVAMAGIGGFLKAVEAVLQVIAPLTKWTWDDNLATKLGKLLALKVFNKK